MSSRRVQQVRQAEIVDLFIRMREAYPNLHATRDHSPRAFLRLLVARTGILVEAGYVRYMGKLEPVYEFRHLMFQEYLTARALVDRVFPGYDSAVSLPDYVTTLAGRTEDTSYSADGIADAAVVENWREALRLCTIICHDRDVDSVLLAILSERDSEGPMVARAAPFLPLCAWCTSQT
jgi:hypothetical protein